MFTASLGYILKCMKTDTSLEYRNVVDCLRRKQNFVIELFQKETSNYLIR